LNQLDTTCADELETQWLDFKPWNGPKDDMRAAVEYAFLRKTGTRCPGVHYVTSGIASGEN
jgi:hypothetical protein